MFSLGSRTDATRFDATQASVRPYEAGGSSMLASSSENKSRKPWDPARKLVPASGEIQTIMGHINLCDLRPNAPGQTKSLI